MAPLPKRKFSTSRKLTRFNARKVGLKSTTICKHCGEAKLSHNLCPKCHQK